MTDDLCYLTITTLPVFNRYRYCCSFFKNSSSRSFNAFCCADLYL